MPRQASSNCSRFGAASAIDCASTETTYAARGTGAGPAAAQCLAKDWDRAGRGPGGRSGEARGGGHEAAVGGPGKAVGQAVAPSPVRTGGRLVLLGFAAEPLRLAGGRVTFRELGIIGTLGCRNIDFPIVLDLVRRGRLAVRPLVSHRHRLEDVNAGFAALRRGEGVRHIVVMHPERIVPSGV